MRWTQERNTTSAEDFIANPDEKCEGKYIKVSAQRDGTFTVFNSRNQYSKTYKKQNAGIQTALSSNSTPEK
jgi:hypothetical protein